MSPSTPLKTNTSLNKQNSQSKLTPLASSTPYKTHQTPILQEIPYVPFQIQIQGGFSKIRSAKSPDFEAHIINENELYPAL